MTAGVFVTGTDTGVGKTIVSAALLVALNARGCRAVGMKPVASGCRQTQDGLRSGDAELLIAQSAGTPAYGRVNRYAFEEAIAPHIAARHCGIDIRIDPIAAAFRDVAADAECVVVEGVGGWAVPLSPTLMQADLVRALHLPVILVVGLRLGCINHALLSASAIATDRCELIGWIGNRVDAQMARVDENLETLRERLPAPCLGVLPFRDVVVPRGLARFCDAALRAIIKG